MPQQSVSKTTEQSVSKTTESIWWSYGGLAFRSVRDHRFWDCEDSDYSWLAVTDDFGELVCVSSYTNKRGY